MAYSDQELLALINEPESLTLERKESFVKEKACKTVCAFANDLANTRRSGVLLIGVNDQGQVLGVQVTDLLLQAVDQIKSDARIQPLPSLTVRVINAGEHQVIAIEVQPSNLPPVRFDGRTWVRMAASTHQANLEDERVLNERRRTHAGRSFDSEPVPSAAVDDLDLRYFEDIYLPSALARDVLAANGRQIEEKLCTTRMASGTAPCVPTVAGLLTLGWSAQDFLSGAYVQFIRYAGTEQGSAILDEEAITGNLETVIRRSEERLKAHITSSVRILGTDREKVEPSYPLEALQQLLRNAILHRNYEGTNAPTRMYWFADRLEIWNPGGPFGLVTRENFGQPYATDYRNPCIAEVLRNLGFVQKFGFGIQSARQTLAANGNPAPEFKVEQGYVLVTIRQRPE
ncbi:MAG: putative DNA binding domain-containing protein [Curvibacter sp.]|nr:putative DNA binding domain-containing protein [Curvibacter sp.]